MIKRIRFIVGYWLLWLFVFELARLSFVLFNPSQSSALPFLELMSSFWHGFRMDASMISYIVLPVCLLTLIQWGFSSFPLQKMLKWYTAVVLLWVVLLETCNIPAFAAWGAHLDAGPLKYLSSPNEAWASVSHLPIVWIGLGFVMVLVLLYNLFRFYIQSYGPSKSTLSENKIWGMAGFLLFTVAQIIPLRGGFQLAPINQSSVYFSTNHFLNLSAVNVPWNFVHSLTNDLQSTDNPFVYLPNEEAIKLKKELLRDTTGVRSFIDLTTTPKPNVILIVWESFTQKVVDQNKNGIVITPGFNALKKEGIYFSNIYASGDRTDKGIVALLSGYPAQPITSIIKVPQKASKLPTITQVLKKDGYNASFYYGGELEFANMKAYLLGCGFDQYTSINDFDPKDLNSKWGAHDGVVEEKVLKDVKKMPQPFFTTWLTLSSHEPFETPVPTEIQGKDEESLFLNAHHYTDQTITHFIEQCKKEAFWKNTVVIMVGDHGHPFPRTNDEIDRFKIPLLLLGGALSQKGITIDQTGSQTDIAATLLEQLNLDHSAFDWSKNMLSEQRNEWAYFAFNNGFGFVEPQQYFLFDNVGKRPIEIKGPVSNAVFAKGKALQQLSFEDYLSK